MFKTYETQADGWKAWSPAINMTESPGHDGEPCIRFDKVGGIHLAYHYLEANGNMEIYYTTKPGYVAPKIPEPPTTISLVPTLNTDKTKKTNTITWTNNPANTEIELSGNKIWRKPLGAADSAFALLATVSPTAIQFPDSNLDILTKYSYRVTVLSKEGEESVPSAAASESSARQFEFAPTSVAVSSGVNKILFYREKRNTITFGANANNPTADVSGFEIHRKLTQDPDSSLALVATVGAATLTYTDVKLSTVKNYSYAVKTKFSDGKTSAFSTMVGDK
jgi:hypothetical protein